MEKKSKNILLKKFFKNKKVLVTGANGFKGLWLSMTLKTFGSDVYGIGIRKNNCLLSNYINLKNNIKYKQLNINDDKRFKKFLLKTNPDIIFHLASESLVNDCNNFPKKAFETNILGLVNLFEIYRKSNIKKKIQINIITSDKCYLPSNKRNYIETDSLGGEDIYSASKSCQEIVTKSYYESFFKKKNFIISTFRAGNVIGGGDYSSNRLFSDIAKSLDKNKKLNIRNKNSTRPWQHVLDCLNGYLLTSLYLNQKKIKFSSWNFAPTYKSKSVKFILEYLIYKKYLKKKQFVFVKNFLKESLHLNLSSKKTQKFVGWKSKFSFEETIDETILFYIEINKFKKKKDLLRRSLEHKINNYFN